MGGMGEKEEDFRLVGNLFPFFSTLSCAGFSDGLQPHARSGGGGSTTMQPGEKPKDRLEKGEGGKGGAPPGSITLSREGGGPLLPLRMRGEDGEKKIPFSPLSPGLYSLGYLGKKGSRTGKGRETLKLDFD